MSGSALDAGLRSLVRLSAALARGLDHSLTPFLEDAARAAEPAEVEEALLQSYLFLGYPVALTALGEWRRVGGLPAPPPSPDAWEAWAERGAGVCRSIYGRAYGALRTKIASLSPDLDRWMVAEGYGKVLGRPGMSLWRRECCISAMLAVLGAVPQLRSHLRGALRAGASSSVVDEVVAASTALASVDRAARAMETWNAVKTRWEEA